MTKQVIRARRVIDVEAQERRCRELRRLVLISTNLLSLVVGASIGAVLMAEAVQRAMG